ncbi:MAG: hypothetical protein QOI53_3374 [Verrucomicrobiota bacterium]|nr:hypothetical protein [Verrucomicrobiota bacterium]
MADRTVPSIIILSRLTEFFYFLFFEFPERIQPLAGSPCGKRRIFFKVNVLCRTVYLVLARPSLEEPCHWAESRNLHFDSATKFDFEVLKSELALPSDGAVRFRLPGMSNNQKRQSQGSVGQDYALLRAQTQVPRDDRPNDRAI